MVWAIAARAFVLEVTTLAYPLIGAAVMFFGVIGIGPHTGRYQVATVLSASMRPTFDPGALVFATPVDATALRMGDIVMTQAPLPGRPIFAHRVVGVGRTAAGVVVHTKGDANNAPDPWETRIEGRAWRVRTHADELGYAIQALRKPHVQRLLGRLVPALLVAVWLVAIWRPKRDDGDPTSP